MNLPESIEIQTCTQPLFVAPDRALQHAGRTLLTAIGEDLDREGLVRTPYRFAKAIRELCSGYAMSVTDAIGEGVFSAEGSGLVAVRDVDFHSLCEHHVLPFWGRASVAYYPAGKILGLSKIPRLVDCFARRLQVQERLTKEIAEAVDSAIAPRAIGIRIMAEHMCMRMRGVEKTHGTTATEFLIGGGALSEGEIARLWASIS